MYFVALGTMAALSIGAQGAYALTLSNKGLATPKSETMLSLR